MCKCSALNEKEKQFRLIFYSIWKLRFWFLKQGYYSRGLRRWFFLKYSPLHLRETLAKEKEKTSQTLVRWLKDITKQHNGLNH